MIKQRLAPCIILALLIVSSGCIWQPTENLNAVYVPLTDLINNSENYYMPPDLPRRFHMNFFYYTYGYPLFITETKEIFGYSRVSIFEIHSNTTFKGEYLLSFIGASDELDPFIELRLEGTLLKFDLGDNVTAPFFMCTNFLEV